MEPSVATLPQTMRDLFPEYYRPSKTEYDELFSKCLLVADANVLLDFYRVQTETREQLFRIFEGFGERFWIPNQAALEFQRNRIKVRHDQSSKAATFREGLSKIQNQVVSLLQDNNNKNHAFLDSIHWLEQFNHLFDEIELVIKNKLADYPDVHAEDDIQDRITALIGEKVGPPYDQKTYDKYIADGKNRYPKDIPPGFEDERDKDKVGDRKYGDFILWRQIIDKANVVKKPIVLVTRDVKQDWMHKVGGKNVGPLPELVREMFDEAGVRFYLYETPQFMKYAGTFLDEQVSQKAIDEVEDLPDRNDYPEVREFFKGIGEVRAKKIKMPDSYARRVFAKYLYRNNLAEVFGNASSQDRWQMYTDFCEDEEVRYVERLQASYNQSISEWLKTPISNAEYMASVQAKLEAELDTTDGDLP